MATDAIGAETQASKPSVQSTLPKELSLDDLKKSTDQFSEERILENSAYGVTYKGISPDGEVIAVKRLSVNGPIPPHKAFQNEVMNIMKASHENIVKLIGYCHEAHKKVLEDEGSYYIVDIVESLICYEYLPQRSLHEQRFGNGSADWSIRFTIIKGICDGLRCMHMIPIVHMDLKPENIWLDNKMVAKIANFGLSRLLGQDKTRQNTGNVVGSYGYIAPEYFHSGEISTQSDIYSLGVLMIEITTGERNSRESNEPSARSYIERIRSEWTPENIASKYSQLDAECLQQVHACIQIGLECVHVDPKKRPSIETIINKLNER